MLFIFFLVTLFDVQLWFTFWFEYVIFKEYSPVALLLYYDTYWPEVYKSDKVDEFRGCLEVAKLFSLEALSTP